MKSKLTLCSKDKDSYNRKNKCHIGAATLNWNKSPLQWMVIHSYGSNVPVWLKSVIVECQHYVVMDQHLTLTSTAETVFPSYHLRANYASVPTYIASY